MKIKFRFQMTQRNFEDLFDPCPMKYHCGIVHFGGLTGVFWRNPDGNPTFEIRDGQEVFPQTIEVPTGCRTFSTFKKKVKDRITRLVLGELFEAYCRAEKFRQMAYCLTDVMTMMRHAGRGYVFLRYNPCALH